jgi:arylsulfatase
MSDDRRNIVLLSIDSLRADHCGHLGNDQELTPTIDTLADEGAAFQNAIAPGPQTFSSMPAVFTGRHQLPARLENYPYDNNWEQLLAMIDEHLHRYSSIPERLQELGYDTAGISPNPWTCSASGFDRGFDQFADYSEKGTDGTLGTILERVPGINTDARSVDLVLNMLSGAEFFAHWESLYEEIERLREQLSEPYFLWVFILDTHFPFIASRTYRQEQSLFGTYYSAYRSSESMRGNSSGMSEQVRESVQQSYRDTVRASDAFIERIQSDLADDDPVLMIHSDHGESFGDHGNYGHHHNQVYEENIHVPFIVHNAGVHANVSGPTSLTTVHDIALRLANGGTFDPADVTEPYVVASSVRGNCRTVRGSRFKYIEHNDDRLLFDLEADPAEKVDISGEYTDIYRTFQQHLTRLDRHNSETDRLHRATTVLASHGGV